MIATFDACVSRNYQYRRQTKPDPSQSVIPQNSAHVEEIAYFCAYLSSLCVHLLECPTGPQCTVSIEQAPSSEMLSRRGGDSYLSNALDEQLFRLPPIELVDRIRRLQILRQVVGSIQWNEQMWRSSILLARSEKLAQSGNV